jgi:hypothetical protein
MAERVAAHLIAGSDHLPHLVGRQQGEARTVVPVVVPAQPPGHDVDGRGHPVPGEYGDSALEEVRVSVIEGQSDQPRVLAGVPGPDQFPEGHPAQAHPAKGAQLGVEPVGVHAQ